MEATGCATSPLEAYQCLQDLEWQAIQGAMPLFLTRFVVDGARSNEPVMPADPEVLFTNGDFNQAIKYFLPLYNFVCCFRFL